MAVNVKKLLAKCSNINYWLTIACRELKSSIVKKQIYIERVKALTMENANSTEESDRIQESIDKMLSVLDKYMLTVFEIQDENEGLHVDKSILKDCNRIKKLTREDVDDYGFYVALGRKALRNCILIEKSISKNHFLGGLELDKLQNIVPQEQLTEAWNTITNEQLAEGVNRITKKLLAEKVNIVSDRLPDIQLGIVPMHNPTERWLFREAKLDAWETMLYTTATFDTSNINEEEVNRRLNKIMLNNQLTEELINVLDKLPDIQLDIPMSNPIDSWISYKNKQGAWETKIDTTATIITPETRSDRINANLRQ